MFLIWKPDSSKNIFKHIQMIAWVGIFNGSFKKLLIRISIQWIETVLVGNHWSYDTVIFVRLNRGSITWTFKEFIAAFKLYNRDLL